MTAGIVDEEAARAWIEDTFLDDVTLRRPSAAVDAEGDSDIGESPMTATTRGTLTVRDATGSLAGDHPAADIDATLSLSLAVDAIAGDLADVRGERWRIESVADLRTRRRCGLKRAT